MLFRSEDVYEFLSRIVKNENIDIDEDALEALVHVARGDMRRAVNSLQVAAAQGEKIDVDTIYQTTGLANPEEVKNMLEIALSGNFIGARDKLDEIMIEFGLSGQDIIKQIHSSYFELSIGDNEKVRPVMPDLIFKVASANPQ